jgi:hypothetical protein
MRIVSFVSVVLAGSLLLPADGRKTSTSPNPALAEFEANVQDYIQVRNNAAKSAPELKKNMEPEALVARERALASAIRKARASAKPGHIITPAAQKYFKTITMGEVRSSGGKPVKQTIKQGNPPADKEGADVKLQINGTYPKAAPKSTMPASLLERFPKLPEELEYRFVGRTLILLDSTANLIVDYATEVGPEL